MIKNKRIQKIDFYSELNREKLPYIAILPKDYFETDKDHPVIYLMHGLFGGFENWTELTGIVEYSKDLPFVIICPEGKNSWYLDNETLEDHLFESYILEELIPDVEKRFRIKREKNSRIIGGLSMGGYGAFKFSFRRLEMFSVAFSMSGAFDIPQFLANKEDKFPELHPFIADTFEGISEDQMKREDLFEIVRNFPNYRISELPCFYLDCGLSDSFIELNREFSKLLKTKNIEHNFIEAEGGHGWDYWDERIKFLLERLTGINKNQKNVFAVE